VTEKASGIAKKPLQLSTEVSLQNFTVCRDNCSVK